MTDQEQLSRYAQSGDPMAFEALVSRYLAMVLGVAQRRCGDPDLAEEAAQNTFAILARKAGRLAAHPTVAGWLHRTAFYEAGNLRRAESTRRHYLHVFAREQLADPATHANEPLDETAREMLDRALDRLRIADRNLLLLRYFEGLTFAEIGARLGKSEAAMQKQAERALGKIRPLMSKSSNQHAPMATVVTALVAHFSTDFAKAVSSTAVAQFSQNALAAASGVSGMSLFTNVLITMSETKLALAAVAIIALIAAYPIGLELTRRRELITQLSTGTVVAKQAATDRPIRSGSRAPIEIVPDFDPASMSGIAESTPLDAHAMTVRYGTLMGEMKREEHRFKQAYPDGPPPADSPEFEVYVADMDATSRLAAKTIFEIMSAQASVEVGELEEGALDSAEDPADDQPLMLGAMLGSSIGLDEPEWTPIIAVLERAEQRRKEEKLRKEDRDPSDSANWDDGMRALTNDVLAEIAEVLGQEYADEIRKVNGDQFLHVVSFGLPTVPLGAPELPQPLTESQQ
ncbi:MAG: sigma-70 family RNA polymerase sigma factor [Verrucomicrobiae bacterium]|nr:sigma-70 family RNA polymerase sigma factor [Verrucomicrobiae bacterium]